MAGRYVPPHLRNKASISSGQENTPPVPKYSKSEEELFTPEEIEACFWPKRFDPDNDDLHGGPSSVNSTLHASETQPDKLSYIILFKGANPRWFADKIIYVKSNLDLLLNTLYSKEPHQSSDDKENAETSLESPLSESQPESKTDLTNTKTYSSQDGKPISPPIPIFQEIAGPRPRTIRFAGYHTISNLEILEPHSPDLVRMLEQKWSVTDRHGNVRYKERDAESWKKSLGWRWAVIKFKSDPGADGERGAPKIERAKERRGAGDSNGKSVNEMLKELRMGHEGQEKGNASVNAETDEDTFNEASREIRG